MTRAEDQAFNEALWESHNPRTGDWVSDGKLVLIRFLRQVFHETPRVDATSGKMGPSFHWEADPSVSELSILDKNSLSTDSLGRRPAIIVGRGEFRYGNISIDHMQSMSPSTGETKFTDLVQGSYVLHCVASNGRVAEILAMYVARAVRVFRRELQKAGYHLIGTHISVGEESDAGELMGPDSKSTYRQVPVVFPVYYQDNWAITPDERLLQELSVKLLAVATKFGGGLVDPDSVDEEGRPVEGHDLVIVSEWVLPTSP
jgi:hypothetical protein